MTGFARRVLVLLTAGVTTWLLTGPALGGDPTGDSPVVPEVPFAALLPIAAIAIGGYLLYRRSRRSNDADSDASGPGPE